MENLEVTINLPNLKLNIPEDRINFHTLEQIIFNLSRKIGQEILEELLQLIDDRLMAERERGKLSHQGKRLRYLTTLLGDITFYKRLYQDKGGKYHYLLDEKLGLAKNQRVSKLYEKIQGLMAFLSAALHMALKQRKLSSNLLLHSDRGRQYASDSYQTLLKRNGILCSMSGKGNCWDNAVMESFYRTLKVELIYQEKYETRIQAQRDIFKYIEIFYNRERLHSSLGYYSPEEYEKMIRVS